MQMQASPGAASNPALLCSRQHDFQLLIETQNSQPHSNRVVLTAMSGPIEATRNIRRIPLVVTLDTPFQ